MVKKKPELDTNSIIILSVFMLLTFLLIMLFFSEVELEGEFICNTGYVGLDLEAYNNIQSIQCEDNNLDCFKEDFLLNHIKIKDIDGLNCQGKGKIKVPLIISGTILK